MTSVDLKDKKGGQMFDSIVDDLVDYVEDYTTLKAMLPGCCRRFISEG
jgi:hypothetical protein